MLGWQRVTELYSYDGCAFPCVYIQWKGQKAFVTQNIGNHTNMLKMCVVSGCWDSAEFACSPHPPPQRFLSCVPIVYVCLFYNEYMVC